MIPLPNKSESKKTGLFHILIFFISGSSGMAYLSGMCSSMASCTVAEARSLGSTALIGRINI